MQDIEIPLPANVDCAKVAKTIDLAIEECNLIVTMRDSLKKFPGCIHWHIKNEHSKNGRATGTLEITLWPAEKRAWFTIQGGRKAPWIDTKMKLLNKTILRHLSKK